MTCCHAKGVTYRDILFTQRYFIHQLTIFDQTDKEKAGVLAKEEETDVVQHERAAAQKPYSVMARLTLQKNSVSKFCH